MKETVCCGHTDMCDEDNAEVIHDGVAGTVVAPPDVSYGAVGMFTSSGSSASSLIPALLL